MGCIWMSRPRLGRLAACLLIGLMVAALVPWVQSIAHGDPRIARFPARFRQFGHPGTSGCTESSHFWSWSRTPLWVRMAMVGRVDEASGRTNANAPAWIVIADSFAGLYTFGYGLPWTSSRAVIFGGSGRPFAKELEAMWRPTFAGQEFALPVHPVWQGLFLNALTWTLAVAAPWYMLRAARRRRRLRRGWCVVCAYDMAGISTDTCPECGGRGRRMMTTTLAASSPGEQP
jgi:hypothetical protein